MIVVMCVCVQGGKGDGAECVKWGRFSDVWVGNGGNFSTGTTPKHLFTLINPSLMFRVLLEGGSRFFLLFWNWVF